MGDEIHTRRFRQMLMKLDSLIKTPELVKLKFSCREVIPASRREKISSNTELFETLEEKGKLSGSDLSYLKGVLQDALGRADILKIVNEYEQGLHAISPDGPPRQQSLGPICEFLENKLGREYRSVLRRLGIADYVIERKEQENQRNIKEAIHQCLKQWLQDNETHTNAELYVAIISALNKENRLDLVAKIEATDFS